ncbi:integrase arm-type DNA-binding domain-containing protein [Acidovorax sp.]|uniref:integrase arm-type DNA-binding domain-containing protein n=1 Tax=Acidovorax sp. TaxID=1872122 RepID=UPI0039E2EB0C
MPGDHPSSGKWWWLMYRWAGREKRLSLDIYPEVILRETKRCRDDAKRTLENGADPSRRAAQQEDGGKLLGCR